MVRIYYFSNKNEHIFSQCLTVKEGNKHLLPRLFHNIFLARKTDLRSHYSNFYVKLDLVLHCLDNNNVCAGDKEIAIVHLRKTTIRPLHLLYCVSHTD